MAAGMSDQGVKPNPVSFPRIPGSTVLCYRPDTSPTRKLGQDWRKRLYRAAYKTRKSLSEIVIIAFTSSSLKWKTLGQGDTWRSNWHI